MRVRLVPIALCGLLAFSGTSCKQETVIQQQENVAPVVAINAPTDGAVVTEGSAIQFSATIADDNGLADIQSVVWTSSIDGELGDPTQVMPDTNGASRLATALSEGLHTVTVRVTDVAGAQAEDSIGLTVEAMEQMPTAEIVVPTAFQEYDLGADVDLSGIVGDPNQAPNTLQAVWTIDHTSTGDVYGPFAGTAGTGGITTARLPNAPEGNFLATLEVTDDDGNNASAQVYFLVVDPRDRDDDNDGWTPNQGDCNDGDDAVYPGNDEICDGLDNDCDGQVDNKDNDGDNHIDLACTLYSGTLPLDDCDDDNAAVHPLAPEVSDGLDNDCNGTADDSTPTYDNDGDCFCIGPDPCTGSENVDCAVLDVGDCNDNDPSIDPVDDDGDGASECAGDCDDTDATRSPADLDGDGYSTCAGDCDDTDAALTPVDIDQDGFSTCAGDCDDRPGGCGNDCYPGNTDPDVCNGDDEDCDAAVDEDPERIYYPDLDSDGFIDVTGYVYACADPDGAGTNWTSGTTAPDCDDDPAACGADCFPNNGADDVCDTYNQDCDASVDEDADVIWYHDADGDGFTDSTDTQLACADPDGTGSEWVASPTVEEDCDDDPGACGADCFPANSDPDVCDSYDQDCDSSVDEDAEIPWYADADGDGFTDSAAITYACADPGAGWEASPSAQEDCDDDPSTCGADCFPANTDPDVCDTYDQDCDTAVDEDPDTVWYADLDGDGWTDNASTATQCDAPGASWTSTASGTTDCDDDPAGCGADCFPTNSAADTCDGEDQDCDASVDENPEIDWYLDADGDGATLGTPVFACASPGGTYLADASASLDCDDDPAACGADCFPGNTALDVCDGDNQDCDSFTDEDVDVTWYRDADGDGYTGATTQTSCTDIDGSGTEWLAAPTAQTDCDDGTRASDCGADCFPGNTALDVCDGDNQDCDGSVDEDPQTPYYHDADGDGFTANTDVQYACTDPDAAGLEWRNTPTANDCDDGTGVADCGSDCFPGNLNPDICDGFDQDCSGAADEDPDITWYGDADGDGYTGTSTQLACDDPDGSGINWVASATTTDCLDTGAGAASAFPNNTAPDICDSINQDCDASVDENPEIDWFEDADGDGYTASNVTYACTDPDGLGSQWQANSEGDCDDNPLTCGDACHPGLSVDGCDSYNNDCDASTDEDPDLVWYEDADGDGWTNNSSYQYSCSDPGADWDPAASGLSDCDDASAALNHNDADSDTQTTCEGDCNDGSAFMNTLDADSDGNTTCAGDCDDSNGTLNINDVDGDGYTSCAGDCNDLSGGAGVNPGASDVPDDSYLDRNCDGVDGDVSKAIFVRNASGNNGSNGQTPSTAVKTIAQALSLASSGGRNQILIASNEGNYSITSALVGKSGVSLYGGYSNLFATRSTSAPAEVLSSDNNAMVLTSLTGTVTLDSIDFTTSNQTGSGEEAVTLWLSGVSSYVTLRHSDVTAGRGGDGSDGGTGSTGDDGADGVSLGANVTTGGAGGDESGWNRDGGRGGNGEYRNWGEDGVAGGSWSGVAQGCGDGGRDGSYTGGDGGMGCGDGDPQAEAPGEPGKNGCAASNGGNGTAGLSSTGAISGTNWVPSSGSTGGAGTHGGGGGGGGAGGGENASNCCLFGCDYFGTGRAGGGGGAGGSGGGGGGGGAGGGASVAILLNGGTLTVVDVTVSTVGGGDGGHGGPGGSGGSGGSGGAGATSTDDKAGPGGGGGDGADGGDGGPGGGGAGGPSVGVWRYSGSVSGTVSYGVIGNAGSGGTLYGNDGANGRRASTCSGSSCL